MTKQRPPGTTITNRKSWKVLTHKKRHNAKRTRAGQHAGHYVATHRPSVSKARQR
jgi:hypothetical protein